MLLVQLLLFQLLCLVFIVCCLFVRCFCLYVLDLFGIILLYIMSDLFGVVCRCLLLYFGCCCVILTCFFFLFKF